MGETRCEDEYISYFFIGHVKPERDSRVSVQRERKMREMNSSWGHWSEASLQEGQSWEGEDVKEYFRSLDLERYASLDGDSRSEIVISVGIDNSSQILSVQTLAVRKWGQNAKASMTSSTRPNDSVRLLIWAYGGAPSPCNCA